ncbi:MAG: hypothetical protein CFE26_08050 [Verrucomicrobiales bacterium VVV1]|nr:MAG: hypothetical protein CFE26_08050 [Verrucomicrobiales bacterium VVV1]
MAAECWWGGCAKDSPADAANNPIVLTGLESVLIKDLIVMAFFRQEADKPHCADRFIQRMNHQDAEPSQPTIASERDIAAHLFSTSSVMLGLCFAIISIMRVQKASGGLESIVDDIIAIDSLVFLSSCFLSYAALRVRHLRSIRRVESIADTVFLIGMTGMGVACVLFVWTIL